MINYVSAEDKAIEVKAKVEKYGVKAEITKGVCTRSQCTGGSKASTSAIPNGVVHLNSCPWMMTSAGLISLQDAGVLEDNVRIVQETVDKLGGIDVIVANAGWTRFSNFKDLNAMSTEEWNKVRLLRLNCGG